MKSRIVPRRTIRVALWSGEEQDPIEYHTHTHHTNLDTYERAIEDDVKASAIAIAATLYQLAMRDEMLPRLPAAQMPPLPAPARP